MLSCVIHFSRNESAVRKPRDMTVSDSPTNKASGYTRSRRAAQCMRSISPERSLTSLALQARSCVPLDQASSLTRAKHTRAAYMCTQPVGSLFFLFFFVTKLWERCTKRELRARVPY